MSELSLKGRAVAFLARREHTRTELRKKLAPYAESVEQVETLLDELVRQGFLSDVRFAEAFVRSRRSKFGSQRLAQELKDKGVAPALISDVVQSSREDDLERVKAIWQRKFGTPPEDAKERARQIRFLQSRGFSLEIILKLFRECHVE